MGCSRKVGAASERMEAVERTSGARSDRDAVRAAVVTTGSHRFAGVIDTAAHDYCETDLRYRDRSLQTAGQDQANSQQRRCRQGESDDSRIGIAPASLAHAEGWYQLPTGRWLLAVDPTMIGVRMQSPVSPRPWSVSLFRPALRRTEKSCKKAGIC